MEQTMANVNIVNKPGVTVDGKITLPAIVGRLILTPQPLFGKNIQDWSAEEALEFLEKDESQWPEHDFGTCFIRKGSLRQLVENGEWFVDLAVDNPREVRFHKVVCDSNKKPFTVNGKIVSKPARYTERFVTVPLSMVQWLPDHKDSKANGKTVQYCQRQRSKATAADTVAYALGVANGGNKTKTMRPSPAKMKELLAQLGG